MRNINIQADISGCAIMPKTWTDFSISSILDLEGYKTKDGYLRDEYHHEHRETVLKG
jgi:hypothetical protein